MSQPQMEMQQDDDAIQAVALGDLITVTDEEDSLSVAETDEEKSLSRKDQLQELLRNNLHLLWLYLYTILPTLSELKGEAAREIWLEKQEVENEKPKREYIEEHPYIKRHGYKTVMDVFQFFNLCAETEPDLELTTHSLSEMTLRIKSLGKNIGIEANGDSLRISNERAVNDIDDNIVSVISERTKIKGVILRKNLGEEFSYHIYASNGYIRVGLHGKESTHPIKHDWGYFLDPSRLGNFLKREFLPNVDGVYVSRSLTKQGAVKITYFSEAARSYIEDYITVSDFLPGMYPPTIDMSNELRTKIQDAGYIMYEKDNSLILKKADPENYSDAIRFYCDFNSISFEEIDAWPLWLPPEGLEYEEYIIPPPQEPDTSRLEA